MAQVIEMPKLSDTMAVGTVVKWHKTKGDTVSNGDILAEIETDKATMELENFDEGILLDIIVGEGNEAPIGSPLAIVGNQGEDISSLIPSESIKSEPTSDEKHQEIEIEPTEEKTLPGESSPEKLNLQNVRPEQDISGKKENERIIASPLAKKIAADKNIDLSTITGSGPRGRVTKIDLEQHIGQVGDGPLSDSKQMYNDIEDSTGILSDKVIPITKMRSVIASRLLESKTTIPHFYLQKEINAKPLHLTRAAMNKKLAITQGHSNSSELKITVNDLILKACAETIKWHPQINTSWEKNEIKYYKSINLAFGVAIEDGLLTPVIRGANALSLRALSIEAKALIAKARNKKLMPDEMTGSTFTVTNLGMFGVDFFSGIINPPNAAILSVGASVDKAVIGPCGNVIAGQTMMLGLSCDHRLVDGAVAANFLKSLAENLENPANMFI
ncbi:MAG: dihydrolipoamide acetyltransferase family protein [Opitutales bacterium]|nr:dihydrolipoamide acetyltransferase family protein [Opitutales bacterium]